MILEELKEKLKDVDPHSLMEQLDLSIEDLLYHLNDVIEEKMTDLSDWLIGEDELSGDTDDS